MKLQRIVFVVVTAISMLSAQAYSQAGRSAKSNSTPEPVNAFLGRWDLTLKAPDRDYPSWLEVSEEGGILRARMVGRWGHARALPKVEFSNGRLTFVSPKEEEETPTDITFEGQLVGNTLSGTISGLKGGTWQWTGTPAPSLREKAAPKWGKVIQLFNGKDLTGWNPSGPPTSTWKVEKGNLVSPGSGPELISNSKFEDFKLHVEFNCGPSSNSGVYLRGRYEVQIETDSADEPPSHHTGGIYGFLTPTPELPRKADEWQSFDITLVGRWVTVVQNGQTIIDHQEIPGITGGALDSPRRSARTNLFAGKRKRTRCLSQHCHHPGGKVAREDRVWDEQTHFLRDILRQPNELQRTFNFLFGAGQSPIWTPPRARSAARTSSNALFILATM